jgi:para-aminobenzoate synthetase component 1
MSYIHIGDLQILSGSPEVLLETEGRVIKSYPIKGTCSRYEDNSTDLKMQDRLLKSEKDGAELLMIVDLVRNDLGKICEIGSVQVQSLKTLESFAQVHHLVASVEGKLKAPLAPLQALAELSPGGSITGAPKLKAMEIINELEAEPRGVYTGSIGYAGFNGKSCFNIAIRTATLRKNHLEYWAGGGIVADSNPEAEYEESLQKAKGFFEALERGRE